MSLRKWEFRLQDISDAAQKIERFIDGLEFEDFVKDDKTFDAVTPLLLACR